MIRGLEDSSNEYDVGARMWMWMRKRRVGGGWGVFLWERMVLSDGGGALAFVWHFLISAVCPLRTGFLAVFDGYAWVCLWYWGFGKIERVDGRKGSMKGCEQNIPTNLNLI
jgi:hypothetical protein